jgi:hypothetical protein
MMMETRDGSGSDLRRPPFEPPAEGIRVHPRVHSGRFNWFEFRGILFVEGERSAAQS